MLRIVSFGGVIIWLLKGCKTKLEDEKWDHDIRNAIVGFLSIGLLLGIIYLIMSNHQCPKKIFERLIFKNQLELNRLITYIRQLFGTIEQSWIGVLSVSTLLVTLRTLNVDLLSSQSCSTMATRQYAITATWICILTAFSVLPQKDVTLRCCFIHLKNSSTCHLCLYSLARS